MNVCVAACAQGYTGKYCKERCDCMNGAKCEPTTGQCVCLAGYTGENCQKGNLSSVRIHVCMYVRRHLTHMTTCKCLRKVNHIVFLGINYFLTLSDPTETALTLLLLLQYVRLAPMVSTALRNVSVVQV